MTALVLGRRRQGKSTLALALALSQHATAVVFDPNAQFRTFPHTSDPDRVLTELEIGEELVIVFRPRPEVIEADFSALVQALKPWSDYSFIIDECSVVQSPSYKNPDLERLLRLTPRNVSLIQTTHRLVDTHRLSRALCTDYFFFQTSSGHDLTMIEQELESPELAQAVSQLGIYECAHFTIARGGQRKFWIWKDPYLWHLELANERTGIQLTTGPDSDSEPAVLASAASAG